MYIKNYNNYYHNADVDSFVRINPFLLIQNQIFKTMLNSRFVLCCVRIITKTTIRMIIKNIYNVRLQWVNCTYYIQYSKDGNYKQVQTPKDYSKFVSGGVVVVIVVKQNFIVHIPKNVQCTTIQITYKNYKIFNFDIAIHYPIKLHTHVNQIVTTR